MHSIITRETEKNTAQYIFYFVKSKHQREMDAQKESHFVTHPLGDSYQKEDPENYLTVSRRRLVSSRFIFNLEANDDSSSRSGANSCVTLSSSSSKRKKQFLTRHSLNWTIDSPP